MDEPPEEPEAVEVKPESEFRYGLGTQEQMMKDPKWNGIPPVGNRPIFNRQYFLFLVLLVFIVKLIIWSLYRLTTGTLDIFTNPDNGAEMTYWAGIVAKPVLQLAPVFILWIYMFKERGLPFRFTRKHLFSSIIFGCIMGLIYYFVASYVLIGVMMASGQGADFVFVAGWDDAGWWLIIAMMFSFMIGTGPTEEIFARGFIQDQTARAYPLWFAIVFTSILFAIGHLPISIFVYHLGFITIVWYMIVLVIMGGFFSILYQWSRNIVFPIIIHGLWDWYLSLYAIRGAYSPSFLADYDVNFGMMDFVSTILTLSIMLPIFYIIYLVWWKHDKPLEEGPLANIVLAIERLKATKFIIDRDRGTWPKRNPILITAAIVFIFCLASIPLASVVGTHDPMKFVDRMIGAETETIIVYDNGTVTDSGNLNEYSTTEVEIGFNEKYIDSISIRLTWTDEPTQFIQGTNEPDEFKIELFNPEGQSLDHNSGSSGSLMISWSGTENVEYNGNFTVAITLVIAGDDMSFTGLRIQADNSNDYSLDIDYQSYSIKSTSGDSADVRWQE